MGDLRPTVLADRAGTAEHYDRLSVVLAPSACFPGRSEPGRSIHGPFRVEERDGGGREGKRDRRGLVERQAVGNLLDLFSTSSTTWQYEVP